MSLFDQLRPASFRGFEFGIPSDTVTQNMRIHTHKYPGKDEPFHENMGLDVTGFSVEAAITGEDFVEKAASFEALLNKKTQGILVHPYYGELDVVVLGHSRTHVYDQVGIVSFSIRFEKYGAPIYPAAAADTSADLLVASDAAFKSLEDDFNNNFIISGMPDFVSGDALDRLNTFNEGLSELLNITNTGHTWSLNDLSDVPAVATNIFKSISATAAPVNSSLVSLRTSIIDNVISPLKIIQLLLNGTDTPLSDQSSPATGTQSIRIKNAQNIELLMHAGAITSAAATERFAQYESQDQANSFKMLFVDKINDLSYKLADAGWDDGWRSMNSITASITRDINERVGRLPYTLTIKPQAMRPSLALANHLYGDDPSVIVTQAQDMVLRNKIRNPGFVPSEKMEVLVNAA